MMKKAIGIVLTIGAVLWLVTVVVSDADQKSVKPQQPQTVPSLQKQKPSKKTAMLASSDKAVTVTGIIAPAGISSQVQYSRPTNDDRAILIEKGILPKQ